MFDYKRAREALDREYEQKLRRIENDRDASLNNEAAERIKQNERTVCIVSEQAEDGDPLSGFEYPDNLKLTYYLDGTAKTEPDHSDCSGQFGCGAGCRGKEVTTYTARMYETKVNSNCKPITFTGVFAFLIVYFREKEGIDIILEKNNFAPGYIYNNADSVCTCKAHNYVHIYSRPKTGSCKFHEFLVKHIENGDPRMIGEFYKVLKTYDRVPINDANITKVYKSIHRTNPELLIKIIKGTISNIQSGPKRVYRYTTYDVYQIIGILTGSTSKNINCQTMYMRLFWKYIDGQKTPAYYIYGNRKIKLDQGFTLKGTFSEDTLRENLNFDLLAHLDRYSSTFSGERNFFQEHNVLVSVTFSGSVVREFNCDRYYNNCDLTSPNAFKSVYNGTISNLQVVSLSKVPNFCPVDRMNNKIIGELFWFMSEHNYYKEDVEGLKSIVERFDRKAILNLMSKYDNLIEQFVTTDTFTNMMTRPGWEKYLEDKVSDHVRNWVMENKHQEIEEKPNSLEFKHKHGLLPKEITDLSDVDILEAVKKGYYKVQ